MSAFELAKSPLSGTNLLEASAGTGKTYTIAGLFLRLVLEKSLRVDQILVVTYTVPATEELRDRIRKRLYDGVLLLNGQLDPKDDELLLEVLEKFGNDKNALTRLHNALTGFDKSAIYTIHSFCQRMLLENAFESSALFDTELTPDPADLVREIVDDFWRRNLYTAHPIIAQYIMDTLKYEGLHALAGRLSIDPSFTIVPEAPPPDMAEIAAVVGSIEETYRRCSEIWTDCGKDVSDLLMRSAAEKKLSGTTYNIKHIPKRIGDVETYLSGGSPMAKMDHLKYFTPEQLSAVARDDDVPRHEFFDRCGELMRLRETLGTVLDRYILNLKVVFLDYVKNELRRRKRARNIRAFDDLLEDMYRSIHGGGGQGLVTSIRGKFHAALIDEFQDTDSLQYGIFTGIFAGPDHILYLIGDPKQAIYRFRGADIFAYMKAASRADARATLATNYRSEPGLIAAVNAVFSRIKRPFVFEEDLVGYHPVSPPRDKKHELLHVEGDDGAPLRIWFMGSNPAGGKKKGPVSKATATDLAARATAAEIARLVALGREGRARIGDKNLQPGDIAVLVRKRDQARLMQRELSRLGIPGVLHGADSVFHSAEALEIERIMAAAAEPGNESRIKAALATSMLGADGNDICRMMGSEAEWEAVLTRFSAYHDLWARRGFMRMFRALMEEWGVRPRLLSLPDGERRVTNMLHCAEVIHRAEIDGRTGFDGLLSWFAAERSRGEDSEEMEQRLETDEQAVKLVTVHKSKGLEYPVVFCPFVWDTITIKQQDFVFHAPGAEKDGGYVLTLDIGSDDERNRRMARREELAENVRLLYVAMTRAKHRCFLVWGKINESDGSAPAYVFHRPDVMDMTDPMGAMKARMGGMSDEEMLSDLAELRKSSGGTIDVLDLPLVEARTLSRESAPAGRLSCRKFTGAIRRDWAVTSYSALTSGAVHDAGLPDHDFPEDDSREVPAAEAEDGIFAFPRGSGAGTCIHSIFEELDYASPDDGRLEEITAVKLARYGFDPAWRDTISGMARRVLTVRLNESISGLSLENVGRQDRLNELEFCFPLRRMTPEVLARAFDAAETALPSGFPESLESLGFSPRGGFMRGFIDLVFRHGGRYYLVDWKSNHLGNSVGNYSQDALLHSMKSNYYILQYYLYTVALHRYLGLRLKGYDYRKHFGGVYYIFVRGVDPGRGPAFGIYRDVPSAEAVMRLDEALADPEGATV